MQTIKTFIVVALLLAVCYGAFVALNAPVVGIPEELQQWANSSDSSSIEGFEIPSIEMPDSFMQQPASSNASSSSKADDTSLPIFPPIDSSTIPPIESARSNSVNSNMGALPVLPRTNQSDLPTAQLMDSKVADSSSNLDSAWGKSPPAGEPSSAGLADSGGRGDFVPESPIPSGAKLTSNLPAVTGSVELPELGPSIPFNADSNVSALAADDLISAANETGITASNNQFGGGSAPDQSVAAQMASASTNRFDGAAPQNSIAFPQARGQALQLAQQGKLSEALEMMSQYYENAELGYSEHTDLVDLLDALSREVIYSNRNLLAPAYTVTAQDTLQGIAEKYRITPELLAAVNQLGESEALVPNSQIKILEGPFRAQVSLSRGELTLFLRKMYAGRFPVSISNINKPPQGAFEIVDRRKDRTFYGANVVIPAGAPTNPYGSYWLSLGSNLAIHGSAEQVTTDLEGAGCISLAPLDAADAYRILGKGSPVEIQP